MKISNTSQSLTSLKEKCAGKTGSVQQFTLSVKHKMPYHKCLLPLCYSFIYLTYCKIVWAATLFNNLITFYILFSNNMVEYFFFCLYCKCVYESELVPLTFNRILQANNNPHMLCQTLIFFIFKELKQFSVIR